MFFFNFTFNYFNFYNDCIRFKLISLLSLFQIQGFLYHQLILLTSFFHSYFFQHIKVIKYLNQIYLPKTQSSLISENWVLLKHPSLLWYPPFVMNKLIIADFLLSFSEDDFSKNQKSVSIATFYNIRITMADFSYSFVLSIYAHLISALL